MQRIYNEIKEILQSPNLENNQKIKVKKYLNLLQRFENDGWLFIDIIKSKSLKTFQDFENLIDELIKKEKELDDKARNQPMFDVFGIDKDDIGSDQTAQLLKGAYAMDKNKWKEDQETDEMEELRKKKEERISNAWTRGSIIRGIENYIDNLIWDITTRWGSDIHIEPKIIDKWNREFDLFVRVRFRLNWDLIDQPQHSFYNSEISATAVIQSILDRCEGVNIGKMRSVPLDWKFTYFFTNEEQWIKDKKLEVRVASTPLIDSVWVVMRILGWFKVPALKNIGLRSENSTYFYDQFMLGLKKSEGLVLVTWPTGSWKTSTLNSTMNYLTGWDKEAFITGQKRQEVKCITAEDPVELILSTAVQTQVSSQSFAENKNEVITFGKFGKAALRSDPEIILIWELRWSPDGNREEDTVLTAIKMAVTWHQVLGTLHTSSCSSTITRILWESGNWVLESLVDSLNMILAQRLVKTPCKHCEQKRYMTSHEAKTIAKILTLCRLDTLKSLGLNELIQIKWDIQDVKFLKENLLRTEREDLKSDFDEKISDENFKKEVLEAIYFHLLSSKVIKKAKIGGCEHCNHTGYGWRTPLFEIMIMTKKLKREILRLGWDKVNAVAIEDFAMKEWMPLLAHWWILRMLEWEISYEDLDALVNLDFVALD